MGFFKDKLLTSVEATVRELGETRDRSPLCPYYAWATRLIRGIAREQRHLILVEIDDGLGPISRRFYSAKEPDFATVRCVRTADLSALFENRAPGLGRALIVANIQNAALPTRQALVSLLATTGRPVVLLVPLRPSLSALMAIGGVFLAAVCAPFRCPATGLGRRLLLTFIAPIAPTLLLWRDAYTCTREWTPTRWRRELVAAGVKRQVAVHDHLFSRAICW